MRSGRQTQVGRDRSPFGVEQHGVFRGRREHATFFEADDEKDRAAGVAGLRQVRGVEMTRARTLGRDSERLHSFPDEPQRLGQCARKLAQRAELADMFLQRGRRAMIERIAACGPALEVEYRSRPPAAKLRPRFRLSAPRPQDR